MANNMTSYFIENTWLIKHNSFPHLIQSISPNLENELDLYENSKYYSDAEFINMFNETHNEIAITNLNCCMLNARIDALKIFFATVDRHSRISCITLQETWCDESTDMTKYILPGYTMITKFKRTEVSNHGGLFLQ